MCCQEEGVHLHFISIRGVEHPVRGFDLKKGFLACMLSHSGAWLKKPLERKPILWSILASSLASWILTPLLMSLIASGKPQIKAVEIDAPGCSFNPDYEQHQDSVAEAVAAEMNKIYEKEHVPRGPRIFDHMPDIGDLEALLVRLRMEMRIALWLAHSKIKTWCPPLSSAQPLSAPESRSLWTNITNLFKVLSTSEMRSVYPKL